LTFSASAAAAAAAAAHPLDLRFWKKVVGGHARLPTSAARRVGKPAEDSDQLQLRARPSTRDPSPSLVPSCLLRFEHFQTIEADPCLSHSCPIVPSFLTQDALDQCRNVTIIEGPELNFTPPFDFAWMAVVLRKTASPPSDPFKFLVLAGLPRAGRIPTQFFCAAFFR
jgi:hypothetical protein